MAYVKYRKGKASPITNRNTGSNYNFTKSVQDGIDYISDTEKTKYLIPKKWNTSQVFQAGLRYVQNEKKTAMNTLHLVSGHNCNPNSAVSEFQLIEQAYHANKTEHLNIGDIPNVSYHVIISYPGTDYDPVKIHEAGVEFSRRFLGDRFQAVIATHLNTQNYHNHIYINAYALDCNSKLQDEKNLYKTMQEISNEIDLEYGFPLIEDAENAISSHKQWEHLKIQAGESWKESIRADILKAAKETTNWDTYLLKMKEYGYEIKVNRRSVTYKKDGQSVRSNKLGNGYKREALEKLWNTYEEYAAKKELAKQIKEKKVKEKEAPTLQKAIKKNQFYNDSARFIAPEYDIYGRRLSSLKRLLITVRNLLNYFEDDYTIDAPQKNLSIILQSASYKIKHINRALDLMKEYDFQSQEEVEGSLQQFTQALKFSNTERKNALKELNKITELTDCAEKIVSLRQRLEDNHVSWKPISKELSQITLLEQKASLAPMPPWQKSSLYKALHNSGYRLLYPFKCISSQDADEIIRFVTHKSNTQPELLIPLVKGKLNEPIDLTVNRTYHLPVIDNKELHSELSGLIEEFRSLQNKLHEHGIYSEVEMNSLFSKKEQLSLSIERLTSISAALYKEQKLIEYTLNLVSFAKIPEFSCGITYPDTEKVKEVIDTAQNIAHKQNNNRQRNNELLSNKL